MEMKALIAAAALVSASAMATDLTAVVSLSCDGEPVVTVTTVYSGLTPASAAALKKRADQVLDAASKEQDKGGPCVGTWQWGNQNAVETPGMTRQGAHKVAQRAAQFGREAADLALGGRKGRQWAE